MRKYTIRPTGIMGSSAIISELGLPSQYALFDLTSNEGTVDLQNYRKTYRKRPGYDNLDTDATGTDDVITGIASFINTTGGRNNAFFKGFENTGTDSRTDVIDHTSVGPRYSTGYVVYADTVEGIVDNEVFGDMGVTTWVTDGVVAGDYVVLDDDDAFLMEVNAPWAEISAVDEEKLTLTANYTGTTSAAFNTWAGSEKTCIIRKPFHSTVIPDWCVYDNNLIFTFYDEYVWKNPGDGTGSVVLDTTEAAGFKYCASFANRVILGHEYSLTPMGIKWCKNGDETDWTDSTAGTADLVDMGNEIRGLSVVGNDLVVYTDTSIIWGNKTGVAEAPLSFGDIRWGLGLHAPKSLLSVRGQDYLLGYDNFYRMDGRTPIPIGDAVITEVLDSVTPANLALTTSAHFETRNEIWWSLGGGGRHILSYDYTDNTWNYYRPGVDMQALGVFTFLSEPYVIGGQADTIYKFDKSYLSDNAAAITPIYVTPVTDFSDQDEEAFNKFKTVYGARMLFKNITVAAAGSITLNLSIRTDESAWSLGAAVTLTKAEADALNNRTGVLEFDFIKTGNHFQFKIWETSADDDWEMVGIEIDYDIRGDYFGI